MYFMNHSSGSYVGITQKKDGRPYFRSDHIFTKNSLLVNFGALNTACSDFQQFFESLLGALYALHYSENCT